LPFAPARGGHHKVANDGIAQRQHVLLKPCQLNINGAPVNATADSTSACRVIGMTLLQRAGGALAPLVNSFQPDRKGQIGGHFSASAQVKGEGTTGVNLQKNLSGQFNVLATNLNLSIVNVRSPVLKP